jgi:transglutaminase-like putative cysteine protease
MNARKAAWCGALALTAAALAGSAGRAADSQAGRFSAHHEAVIRDIPAGAKKARVWLVVPREDAAQKVGEIKLTGPGPSRVAQGGTYGNRYAYFEIENPPSRLTVSADFTVERREAGGPVNAAAAKPLSEDDRLRLQRELEANRYVPVNDKYARLAKSIVGGERNTVRQAKRLYEWVLDYVEYWVKDPKTLKASPNGESEYCLASRTGNCTDFHSLYASLSRSIGIPTRMVYGSLFQGENNPIPNKASLEGKDTDASYHCWVEFYAGGIGWVPLDVALADQLPTPEQREWNIARQDNRRVTWSYGRDLTLAPKQDGPEVNAMHTVYVEIDGKPHPGWDRKFTYRAH